MTRHFLQLYLLIVATLIIASWGQDQLLHASARRDATSAVTDGLAEIAVLKVTADQLRDVPRTDRPAFVAELALRTRVALDLFDIHDIAGPQTLVRLKRAEPAFMQAAGGERWLLYPLNDTEQVLAFRYPAQEAARSGLEWLLVFVFYTAIALVVMLWLWPLTRDLRELERSTTSFGNRNWKFDARLSPRSQVYPLAEAFRRVASRIDNLIGSQKDLSNALSHEIKTPLARMRFEIELARAASDKLQINEHLDHINGDVTELDRFVGATLDYAILERAEVALNIAHNDFTQILTAICESVRRTLPSGLTLHCEVAPDATRVSCDAHLMETVVRNLLYNAVRHATSQVRVSFAIEAANRCSLSVDDDGPGIPAVDRERIFESFVRLDPSQATKSGYGLGLAIVRRIVEWHEGRVVAESSALGGARLRVEWPM
jgi:signal transduction histidine kinase